MLMLIFRYAANAIVLPSLDMYSNLLSTDAPTMIDHLLSTNTTASPTTGQEPTKPVAEIESTAGESPRTEMTGHQVSSPFWAHWRGRYGSSEEDQARIWSSIDPSDPGSSSKLSGRAISQPLSSEDRKQEVSLVFRTWEGEKRTVSAFLGDSLLEVARRKDLPSMEGTCEGNLGASVSPHPCHLDYHSHRRSLY